MFHSQAKQSSFSAAQYVDGHREYRAVRHIANASSNSIEQLPYADDSGVGHQLTPLQAEEKRRPSTEVEGTKDERKSHVRRRQDACAVVEVSRALTTDGEGTMSVAQWTVLPPDGAHVAL